MDAEVLKTVGQIAGIGGLALGVFLLLFREIIRKNIFPKLRAAEAYRLLTLITGAVWSVAIVGIIAWVYVETRTPPTAGSSATAKTGIANTGTQTFHGPVNVGRAPSEANDR
jgi:hypothetical protein